MRIHKVIIFALLISFTSNGLHAVSIQDLIDRNDVPKPQFFRALNVPMPYVSMLDLSGRQLSSLKGFENLNLEGVHFIRLNNNNLTTLPSHAFKNKHAHLLRGLDLSNNDITQLKSNSFSGLRGLWILVLNNNNIESAKGLKGMPRLKMLAIHNNPLTLSRDTVKVIQKQVPSAYIWNWPVTKERLKKAGLWLSGIGVLALIAVGATWYAVTKKGDEPHLPPQEPPIQQPETGKEVAAKEKEPRTQQPVAQPERPLSTWFMQKHPLVKAAEEGKLADVQRILQEGPFDEFFESTKSNALEVAVENKHPDVALELLGQRKFANYTSPARGRALRFASKYGYYEVAQALLETGIAQHAQEKAFEQAAEAGQLAIVQLLKEEGKIEKPHRMFDIPSYLENAFTKAAQAGHQEIMRELLKDTVPSMKKHALDVAIAEHQIAFAKELLQDKDIDQDIRNKVLITAAEHNNLEIVNLSLDTGVDKENVERAFRAAAREGSLDIVNRLLERPEIADNSEVKKDALFNAASSGHPQVVKSLLEAGVSKEAQENALKTAQGYSRLNPGSGYGEVVKAIEASLKPTN